MIEIATVLHEIDWKKKKNRDGGDCATFDPDLDSFARAEEHYYGCLAARASLTRLVPE